MFSITKSNLDFYREAVSKYSPIIHFHSLEDYFTCNLNDYTRYCDLFDKKNNSVLVEDFNDLNDFENFIDENLELQKDNEIYFLRIKDDKNYFGDVETSEIYATISNISEIDESFEINYWMFYPFNGYTSLLISPYFGEKYRCISNIFSLFHYLGTHQADWEHIKVKITNQQIEKIYYSAHGSSEGRWYFPNEIEFTENHPHVYSAWHSHASYPFAGTIHRTPSVKIFGHSIKIPFIGWLLKDYTNNKGITLNTCEISILSDDQTWLKYGGRWGSQSSIIKKLMEDGPHGPLF